MLNIAKIKNGIVIDHIKAGQGMRVFNWLGLDKAPYTVAFVVNAGSKHMGRKDIIKIDNEIAIDLTILGLIDPNITVNVIQDEKITEKIRLRLPERVEGVLVCKNPRCVTATERYVPHIFHLTDETNGIYSCEYCDEPRNTEDFR